MKHAQHIEELQAPPLVGRRYWVQCVRAKGMLWPVIGPQHADADLGVPEEHLHCDARFMNTRQVQHNLSMMFAAVAALPGPWQGAEAFIQNSPSAAMVASALALQAANLRPPTPHHRVCKREAVDAGVAWFLPQLKRQHAAVRAVDCRVCPHRGTPLSSLPADERGGVVCPAHGLRWSKTTGLLMPRVAPPNLATPEEAQQYRDALRAGPVRPRVAADPTLV